MSQQYRPRAVRANLWDSAVTSAIIVHIIVLATAYPPPNSQASVDNQTKRNGNTSGAYNTTPTTSMFTKNPGMQRQNIGFRPYLSANKPYGIERMTPILPRYSTWITSRPPKTSTYQPSRQKALRNPSQLQLRLESLYSCMTSREYIHSSL